jgi:hypothetical protein
MSPRIEANLRELGFHRGRRGPRSRPAFGWQSLTPTELSVIELVAEVQEPHDRRSRLDQQASAHRVPA